MAIPKFLLAPPLRGLNILMKQTLGIFGDSYADPNNDEPTWNRGWSRMLEDHYLVTNYAWSASSFQYTYNKFMCNHAQHDKCVVLVTSPHRFGWAPMTIDNKPIWLNSYGTLQAVQYTGRGLLTQEDQNRLKALEMYWGYLQQLAGTFLTAPLMLAEIRRQRPDALVIPCFEWEYAASGFEGVATMRDLQSACIRGLRPDWLCDDAWWNQKLYPVREHGCISHLTFEGNYLMAQTVRRHLDQGLTWDPQWPPVLQDHRPWQEYITDASEPDPVPPTNLQRFVKLFSNSRLR